MKKSLLILFFAAVSAGAFAQVKVTKKDKNNNENTQVNTNRDNNDRDDVYYDNDDKKDKSYKKNKNKNKNKDYSNGYGKNSKHIPTKVARAFNNDYPHATNVSWTKSRGDWTARFGNGRYQSSATYHANGERRDAQNNRVGTNRTVIDDVFNKNPDQPTNNNKGTKVGGVIVKRKN